MKIHELTAETSYIIDPVAPGMPCKFAGSLLDKYKLSSRNRHRFCFHQNPNVALHDIIICYDSTSYIPPNKHVGKVESLLIIQGTLDFFLFNECGQVYDYRRLSVSSSEHPFYVRVPPNTWHGLRAIGSKPCIIKETISGPYDSSSLQWASFAPSEANGSEEGFAWYDEVFKQCSKNLIISPVQEEFEQINETVFRSSHQLVSVSLGQLQPILKAAQASHLKRARLCCHGGPEENLQEMFIALTSEVDIEESMHIRKDESLTVISGDGRYLFPNEDGSIRREIKLTSYSNMADPEANFYTRINRYVPHKILVDSPFILIHEATSGPFVKADTDYRLKRADQ
jgi:cupin fold WbuC family metalloprotein